MEAYSVIAKFYDSANTDFNYSKYLEFTKHYLSGKVIELACGSGAFTDYLVKVCDSIIAVDSCSEMLDAAIKNNFKNRKYIQFVNDDILNFSYNSKVDSVISVSDGFNYIKFADLQKAFNKISGYLKNGGYFIFDISNTEMKKDETIKQVENIYKSKHRDWVNKIIIIKNNKVIKVYNRNN